MKTPLTILHLEDSPVDADIIRELLLSECPELEMTRVDNPTDFRDALEKGGFDLILSDFQLVGYNGLKALELARQKRPEVPFVFCSGTIGEERAVESLKGGATDYVLKETLVRLVPSVRRALREAEEQAQLRQAEERLRKQATLLDKAQDAILVRRLDGRIGYWNKSAERIYGWTAAEAMGKQAVELVGNAGAAELREAEAAVLEKGEWLGELRKTTKEGREVIVQSRWTLVRDRLNQPESILIIDTNITEKKKLEAQFLRAQRMESIGTLASGIAHDLNNILAPILMAVQVLRLKPRDEEDKRVMGLVEANAERGANIVKQLLTFGRGVEGARVAIQPKFLVKETIKLIKETFPKNVTPTINVCSDPWTVLGDPTQLYQVLLNLCVNARDAMQEGGILSLAVENIEIDETFSSMCEGAKPGSYVLVQVSDTGVGIPREIQDKIFDPFFTTKEVGKGTGLGLSTVLGIVRSHGGFVQVESEPGRGSVFKVFLPTTAVEGRNVEESKPPELPPGQGEMILVVDDEVGIREMARSVLAAYGYQVLVAEDGAVATALFSQHADQIQVVLTDIGMPIMGGVALVRVLRRMRPQVKIIASSGFGTSSGKAGQMADIEALGVDAVLAKPYPAERLLTLLHQLLRQE